MVKSPSFDRLLIFPLNDHTSMFICDSYRRSRMCLSELTLQLVEEFGSWGRPFAFPLSFSSQVIGMTAHQVPTADIMMNSSTEQKLYTLSHRAVRRSFKIDASFVSRFQLWTKVCIRLHEKNTHGTQEVEILNLDKYSANHINHMNNPFITLIEKVLFWYNLYTIIVFVYILN